MRLRLFPALPSLLALGAVAACESGVGGTQGSYRPVEDACGAAGLQQLEGRPLSELTSMRLDQPIRVLNPGQIVTLVYQADRVSVVVDGSGTITRLACG